MNDKELRELEERADQELIYVDSYVHPIPESSIEQLRKYFSKRKNLQISIQSSYITDPKELNRKYTVIFSRVSTMGGK